jgi:hypothetical protein
MQHIKIKLANPKNSEVHMTPSPQILENSPFLLGPGKLALVNAFDMHVAFDCVKVCEE